jgi:hypothetical protein
MRELPCTNGGVKDFAVRIANHSDSLKFICSNISRAAIRHGGAILIKTSYLNQKNILSSMDGFGV